ncbi:MAG: hypothetical protein ACLSDQ_08655 [Adlercreutzia equolifaciens]
MAEVYALTGEAEVLGILARGHGLGRVQEVLFTPRAAITHRRRIYQARCPFKAELIDSSPASEMMG